MEKNHSQGKKISYQKNFTTGNLYLYEYNDKSKIPLYYPDKNILKKHPSFILDKSFGNVHLLPANSEDAVSYSKIICEKRKKIHNCITELLSSQKENYKGIFHKDKLPKVRAKILDDTPYAEAQGFFAFLSVSGESGTNYDLIFNNFFIDNKQVNCILLCFQIKMYEGEEPFSIDCYPDTSLVENRENKVYHNFEMDIKSDENEIAKAFLDFVIDKEEKKKADSNA